MHMIGGWIHQSAFRKWFTYKRSCYYLREGRSLSPLSYSSFLPLFSSFPCCMDYIQTKEKTQWSLQNTMALGVQRGGSQAYLLMLQAWICEMISCGSTVSQQGGGSLEKLKKQEWFFQFGRCWWKFSALLHQSQLYISLRFLTTMNLLYTHTHTHVYFFLCMCEISASIYWFF